MLQCGAEIFRVEDSLYRMYKSYGFVKYDVYVIPSNIQVTVETPEGEIITQIRHIESSEPNFDQLDYLNNLCRYVCQHTPDENEMREKYLEVINREPQKRITRYAAGIMGGTGFAVFFGCNLRDAVIAFIVSVMIVAVGDWLAKRESNLLVYNGILAFISEVIIIGALKMGIAEPSGLLIGPRGEERVGDVSNVVFTNGAIVNDKNEVFIYYASSDTRMHVATTTIDRLIDYVFNTPQDPGRSVLCVQQRCDLIKKNLEYLKNHK